MGLVNQRFPPFLPSVPLFNSLEPKIRWMAFPGLIRAIGIIHVFVFLLLVFLPSSAGSFAFDYQRIVSGEYWRVISFAALPPVAPGGSPLLSALFMFFAMRITFIFNDGLEEAWGELKASIYVYSVLACMIFAQFLGKGPGGFGGITLYAQLFFAFATLFPRVEFHLFLILPIKVWVLGLISGGILLIGVLQAPGYAPITLLPTLPYLFWAFPRLLKWYVTRGETVARRAKFQQGVLPEGQAFHHCVQCGATDSSHPEREFRVTEEDQELCSKCLD